MKPIVNRPRRGGFTLVEMLVVAAVMITLFGLILTGSKPKVSSSIRSAAQELASVLLAAQSRALGNPTGAGVLLEPADATGRMSQLVSSADPLPMIEGRVTTGMPPNPASAATATVAITPTNGVAADLDGGYRIRFLGQQPTVQPPSPWFAFTGPSTVGMRAADGQVSTNTIWPRSASGTMDVQIARYPAKGEVLLQLRPGVAIDFRNSGTGDNTTTWGVLENKGAIALMFDSVGSIDVIMQQVLRSGSRVGVPQPIEPAQAVYFFVCSKSEIDSGVNTLESSEALWVAVAPNGRVTVAANVPQTSSTALSAARELARRGVALGR